MTKFEFELTDEQWQKIAPVMPKQIFKKGGRPRANDRDTVNGILWTLVTGKKWNELPKKYGSSMTCWRRFQFLQNKKIWPQIWQRYLNTSNNSQRKIWSEAFLDGHFMPVK